MRKKTELPTAPSHDKATDRAYVYWQEKKTYFGKWGSSDANKLFFRWYNERADHVEIKPTEDGLLVAECVTAFKRHARVYYSINGKPSQEFRNLESSIGLLSTFDLDSIPAADFGPLKLAELQNKMIRVRKMIKKKDAPPVAGPPLYCRKTINAHVNRIRRMFRWCASKELLPASVATALEMVSPLKAGRTEAKESGPVKPVPVQDVLATLPFLSPTVQAMIEIQCACGMRPQDICRMTISQIDQSSETWLYRPTSHKTAFRGKTLVKAIPDAARKILEPFMTVGQDDPLFSPADTLAYWWNLQRAEYNKQRAEFNKKRKKNRKKMLTGEMKPRPRNFYSTASYGKAIVNAIKHAERKKVIIPSWSPNQLRHLTGTHLRSLEGIEAAQVFLGHAKPDVTLIYAEASEDRLIEIARRMVSPLRKPKDQPKRKE